ncbi:MAG: hypothetical protein NT075_36725 [Chloroflexi bacterium]|nr:hypothetical protein [Chloroflexota bacterium]
MNLLARWIKAIYNFLVGDMRILIGTLVALVLVALCAYVLPGGTGLLFFGLLAITLTLALRHEITP